MVKGTFLNSGVLLIVLLKLQLAVHVGEAGLVSIRNTFPEPENDTLETPKPLCLKPYCGSYYTSHEGMFLT